ncbi:MAG: dihydrofolate reductase family protein, partial [Planctomycetota bacterium]
LPVRVVFSNGLNLPADARLWIQSHTPTLVYTTVDHNDERAMPLLEQGVEIIRLPAKDNGRGGKRFDLDDAYRDLGRRGMTHLLIEPGPKLAADLVATNRWDRAWVIESPNDVGVDGLDAPQLDVEAVAETDLDGDVLREYLNEDSDAFFGRHASVDFLQVAGEVAVDKIPGKSGRQHDAG